MVHRLFRRAQQKLRSCGHGPCDAARSAGAARMREFVYLCDEGFSAIVKLTMVKYILPKLRN